MGISNLTALTICNCPVECAAGGPDPENGKWVGWIMKDEPRWSPLLNTDPIYDSKEEAVAAMEKLVRDIRKPI